MVVIHLFLRLLTQGCRVVGLDSVAKGELHQQLVGRDSSLPGWKLVPQLVPSCRRGRDRHPVQVGKPGVEVERVVVVPTPSVSMSEPLAGKTVSCWFDQLSGYLTSCH